MKNNDLIPHLFRTEFSKIVAVLCKTFGLSNIEFAEDIVSDTFLIAVETWARKGNPENPVAWLYTVAKNKSKDHFKRQKIFNEKIQPAMRHDVEKSPELEIDLSENNILDSQLQMMFALCNPINSVESQIALALRILCGFGIEEIAHAFLSKKETINKRLMRAKQKLKKNNIDITFPETSQLEERLDSVLSILYLLFNEGYFSNVDDQKIKKDLCFEAMRLLQLLLNNDATNKKKCTALMALFCFHVSRFEARIDEMGEPVLYADQNRDLWNDELILQGEKFLRLSTGAIALSKYHLEAGIAFWHTRKQESEEKWNNILQIYNQLLRIAYSPIAALNRTYALSKVHGNKKALVEALKIDLKENFLYHSLLAELYENVAKQKEHLNIAKKLAKNENDIKVIERKLSEIY